MPPSDARLAAQSLGCKRAFKTPQPVRGYQKLRNKINRRENVGHSSFARSGDKGIEERDLSRPFDPRVPLAICTRLSTDRRVVA